MDVRLYCSWKDGRFVFEKQRLEEIMNTIARWYDINVFYENQSVKDILFTGNIKRYNDLDQVIEMLRLINKIEIEINEKSVFVRSNPWKTGGTGNTTCYNPWKRIQGKFNLSNLQMYEKKVQMQGLAFQSW